MDVSGAGLDDGADGVDDAVRLTGLDSLHKGWSRIVRAHFRLPGGMAFSREVEDHGAGVAVLPYDAERRTTVVVRQFRPPVYLASDRDSLVEAIAGIVESGSPDDCIRREAMEEAGLRLGPLEHVASAWSMPGFSRERLDLYLAPYSAADRIAAGGGLAHEHEAITVIELPLAELAALMRADGVVDMKTLALLQALMLRRPDLF